MKHFPSITVSTLIIMAVACSPSKQHPLEGFILKKGEGEPMLNGIVIKVSPKTGTEGSILVDVRTDTSPSKRHEQADAITLERGVPKAYRVAWHELLQGKEGRTPYNLLLISSLL